MEINSESGASATTVPLMVAFMVSPFVDCPAQRQPSAAFFPAWTRKLRSVVIMADYPRTITPVNHIEPVPRRVRAVLGGQVVLDTNSALYLWEQPNYPQFYIPLADVEPGVLVDEDHPQKL